MTIERISLVVLALIAVLMGANYVSAASRFYDANLAYEKLALTLESFEYDDPVSPVPVTIGVENPAGTAIEVLGLRVTLRAGLQLVGGGEISIDDVFEPGALGSYRIDAHINDVTYMSQLAEDDEISWLVRGEIQVRLDEDVQPVWIDFAVRTVTR